MTSMAVTLAALMDRLERCDAAAGELRLQVDALMSDRRQTEQVILQAQHIVAHSAHSLAGLLSRLEAADRDVYVSVLAGSGVEITHQHRHAADRSDEQTYCGQTIAEAVALAHQHLTETT